MISESEYNSFMYGTNYIIKLQLIKTGLSPMILNFIEENHLESEISMRNGKIDVFDKFKKVLQIQDDFIRFEIEKLIN